MKNKLADVVRTLAVGLILGVVMVGLMHVPFSKAQSQGRERQQPKMAVYISASETYHRVYYLEPSGYTNSYLAFDGMAIDYVSASAGLPVIAPGTPLGEAIAQYASLGLHMEPQPTWGVFLMVQQ